MAILNPSKYITAAFLALLLCFAAPHANAEMTDYPVVKLQSLDKITARTMTFEARVGSTVKFGPLYIKVRACRKSSPLENPESASFLQVWEVNTEQKANWVFSGWMFASSPSLSAMDHPIYDVWVIDCLESKKDRAKQKQAEKNPESDKEDSADEPVDAATDENSEE